MGSVVVNNHPMCVFFPGVCRKSFTESLTERFPGCTIRGLSACTCMPCREGNSIGGPPLYNFGIRNRRVSCENQVFTQTGNQSGTLAPRHCALSTNLYVSKYDSVL